jgi:hypothetical protein
MKIFSAQLKGTTTVVSGSTASITGSFTGSIAGIDINATNQFTASTIARLNSIETISSSSDSRINSLESFTSSTSARLNSIETISASNLSRLSSIETISASNIARLTSLESTSASVDTLNTTQNSRLTNLEIKTGSLASTGSNTFIGTQTITGSLYITTDLIVQGSSSLQNITASAVSIGTNIVNLNTANPAVRYAGLSIGDSGSIGGSGSFLYDSVQDEFIFVHRGTNTTVTSSVVLMGPQTYDNVGNETYPTSNYIQKGTGNEHLVDSCIIDDGTTVCVNTTLKASGQVCGIMGNFSCIGVGTNTTVGKLTVSATGADGIVLSADANDTNNSGRIFFIRTGGDGWAIVNNSSILSFRSAAIPGNTSGNQKLGITTDGIATYSCQICTPHLVASNNISIGSNCTSTSGYNTKLRVTDIANDTFVFSFNNQACKPIMFMYGGNTINPHGYTAWLDNTSGNTNHAISHITSESTYFTALGGGVGIGATSSGNSKLAIRADWVSGNGTVKTYPITSIASGGATGYSLFDSDGTTRVAYIAANSAQVEIWGQQNTPLVFAANDSIKMKIQQNGFIGIGATCAQTYLHVCDSLAAGRDDLVRIQTTMSTNHAWYRSTSCAGVNFIAGANRSNNDGNIRGCSAIIGTTTNHDLDIHTNGIRRMTINNSGGVAFIGNSQDYPTVALCGPTYTMIAMGDRSSSSLTDVGYISIYNQGSRVIDLPGNADAITFNTGGPMIAGRAYASGDARFGYQFLEFCNGQMYHGPLSLGNSGGGVALTPLYCGGGQRWAFGWNTAEMNSITTYNNCTPFLMNWGINGDNPTTDRKFCFNYSGQAYSTSGTWGTLSSNCIIKDCITAANSQWSDIKNICIVNYKMKEEIQEFGTLAVSHLGVVAEQVAEVSPGLLEEGGYSEKWCACLNGVKTSILHMKAVKALQEAMCRIEILESCLGIN